MSVKIESLSVGDTVYNLEKRLWGMLGKSKIFTYSVYKVKIIEINLEKQYAIVSWNGNPPCKKFSLFFKKCFKKEPILENTGHGIYKLKKNK